MRLGRSARAAIIGFALTLGAAACSTGTETTASAPPSAAAAAGLEKTKLKIATLPAIDSAAIYVAIDQGLFEQEGLDVTPEVVQAAPEAIPMMVKGEIDAMFGNYVSMFAAHDKQALKLRILAEGSRAAPDSLSIMALPGSPIKTPKDLEGKTINVNVLHNFQELALTQVLKANNVDPATIKYVQVTFQNIMPSWKGGQIDAAYLGEPMVTAATSTMGARKILDPASGPAAEFPISGYVGTQEWYDKNPKTAAAFQRAIHNAAKLMENNREVVAKVLPNFTQIDAATAATVTFPYFSSNDNPVRLQRVADWMWEAKWLTKEIDVKSLMSPTTSG
ncbi:NitT/TauT family transport system substrate-binding protein [Nonomuraea thailandensis]|uniref:NitT/TauT family transport system substrate-binding protein n=1 Tax=Nonomuraea thailandensis TaxID=1188745 RepID=A0A9X2K684_9ACTN|nr:ABC transporter substrate-binding protein [Nonomuraea thailandensis]MCP2361224.1 NitT/TauT family transport system substrate-binding protein [Nonomuraea thailandensis]